MYNVTIRPLCVDDAKISYKWRNDPEVWKYTGSKPNTRITYEMERQWIENVLIDETSKRFAIIANNKYIGNVQITDIDSQRSAQAHIFIGDKEFWGNGIATKALKVLIDVVQNELTIKELYALVHPQNSASLYAFLNNGFIRVSDDIKLVKIL